MFAFEKKEAQKGTKREIESALHSRQIPRVHNSKSSEHASLYTRAPAIPQPACSAPDHFRTCARLFRLLQASWCTARRRGAGRRWKLGYPHSLSSRSHKAKACVARAALSEVRGSDRLSPRSATQKKRDPTDLPSPVAVKLLRPTPRTPRLAVRPWLHRHRRTPCGSDPESNRLRVRPESTRPCHRTCTPGASRD